jgi:hypothetical protein
VDAGEVSGLRCLFEGPLVQAFGMHLRPRVTRRRKVKYHKLNDRQTS